MHSTPTIIVGILARDEEDRLATVLPPVLPHVDEAVVFDTGSDDHTSAVARSLGAVVRRHPRVRDWAVSSNRAIRELHSDWVLWLCCDEAFSPEGLTGLRALVADAASHVAGFSFYRYTYFGDGRFYGNEETRLFRNRADICFDRAVGESVTHSIRDIGKTVQPANPVLHHFGHMVPERVRREKAAGYLTMLSAEVTGRALKPGELGTRAILLRNAGRLDEALSSVVTACRLGPDKARLHYLRGLILRTRRDDEGADQALARAAQLGYAPFAENMRAVLAIEHGQGDRAVRLLAAVHQHWARYPHLVLNRAVCAEQMGDHAAAADYYLAAARQNPLFLLSLPDLAVDSGWESACQSDTPRHFEGLGPRLRQVARQQPRFDREVQELFEHPLLGVGRALAPSRPRVITSSAGC